MCQQKRSCNSQGVNPLEATAFVASVVSEDRMWLRAQMWKYDALHTSETCLPKDILESRWTHEFFIDDWSLIGEPATDIDCIGCEGLGPWVEKKQWLRILMDWGEDHYVVASHSPWRCRILVTWVANVDEFVPISSRVSSAYWWKDTVVFLFDNSELGWMTLEIGDINTTNKTEPCRTRVGEGVQEEDDVLTLTDNPGNHVPRQAKSVFKSMKQSGMV